MRDGPVFIVGAPRSGTTLLQYILRSHPALSLPTGESHFIVPLMRDESRFGDLSQRASVCRVLEAMHRQSAEFLDTDLHGMKFDVASLADRFVAEGRRSMQALISGLFEANAAGEGKPRWGDKTPYYVLHMPALQRWWPSAQFVHIIRDGRDVALSLFARRHDFGVYNTYFAARYWEQYVETGRGDGRTLLDGQYLEIRYEDLLADQRGTLRQVCSFLDIAFDESMIEFRKSGEAGKTPLLQQPVQKANAEKWRSAMTPAQVATFEGGAARTLRACGYPLTTPASRLALPTRALFRWHNALAGQYHRLMSLRQGET